MNPRWTLGLLICSTLTAQGARPALPDDRAAGAATIDEASLRGWLTTLASPKLAGRGTGTDGFLLAAQLVRDHFRSLGLEPMGDETEQGRSYWQQVPWTRLEADPETSYLEVVRGDEVVCRLAPGDGLHGQAMSSSGGAGPLVWLRAGDADLDAVRELDLAGKIVLVQMRGGGQVSQRMVREIRRGDPAAWVAIDDNACERWPSLAGLSQPGVGAANRAIRGRSVTPNRLYTTTARLEEIAKAAGTSTEALAKDQLLLELTPLRAEVQVNVLGGDAPAYNVIGVLRGSDPKLSSEYVVIGSHLDHLGTRNGQIFPGADDDGSGSAGALAVARALAQNPVKPRRSILFVTFCGEEDGLIGSAFFADHPPIPLTSIVAELQMDMIGRNEQSSSESARSNLNSLHLIGTEKLSADLHELCLEHNDQHAGFDLEWDEEDVFYRSDHFNFARHGVPVAFFFTGFHRDYHKPTDTVEKIDFAKLARVVRYVYDIAFELAQADSRPLVDPARWARLRRELGNRAPTQPAAPLRVK